MPQRKWETQTDFNSQWAEIVNLCTQLGSSDEVVISLFVQSGFLYSASGDGTIRQWNTTSGQSVRTYLGHTGYVHSIFVESGFLYSSSGDGTIGQWNAGICTISDVPSLVSAISSEITLCEFLDTAFIPGITICGYEATNVQWMSSNLPFRWVHQL